ncbi:MAG TPA: prepilin-type N-terminal cleavage/methylation domain-containing protein [Planctomycetota bacterium]|nr:prepilin-type N-terminal cleavage/methylation domain-containing protein [Planctomycetota bacterium]
MTTTADTSRAARAQNLPRAQAQREAILDFIRSKGNHGATCDEAEVALELPHQTCSARFFDLKEQPPKGLGLIETLGEVRKTRTGARAVVYVVAGASAPRRAFTLVELVIVIAIVGIVTGFIILESTRAEPIEAIDPPAPVTAQFRQPTTGTVPGQDFLIQPSGRAPIGTDTTNAFNARDMGMPGTRQVITVTDPTSGRRWLGVEGFGLVEIEPTSAAQVEAAP